MYTGSGSNRKPPRTLNRSQSFTSGARTFSTPLRSPRGSIGGITSPRNSLSGISSPRNSISGSTLHRNSISGLTSHSNSISGITSPRNNIPKLSSHRHSISGISGYSAKRVEFGKSDGRSEVKYELGPDGSANRYDINSRGQSIRYDLSIQDTMAKYDTVGYRNEQVKLPKTLEECGYIGNSGSYGNQLNKADYRRSQSFTPTSKFYSSNYPSRYVLGHKCANNLSLVT